MKKDCYDIYVLYWILFSVNIRLSNIVRQQNCNKKSSVIKVLLKGNELSIKTWRMHTLSSHLISCIHWDFNGFQWGVFVDYRRWHTSHSDKRDVADWFDRKYYQHQLVSICQISLIKGKSIECYNFYQLPTIIIHNIIKFNTYIMFTISLKTVSGSTLFGTVFSGVWLF